MNGLASAAWEVGLILSNLNIPYAIIGGLAVQHWGEPRLTQDVDITVSIPQDQATDKIEQVLDQLSPRLEDGLTFALESRVILVNL